MSIKKSRHNIKDIIEDIKDIIEEHRILSAVVGSIIYASVLGIFIGILSYYKYLESPEYIEEKRTEMKKAIDQSDFEKAYTILDEIREVENKMGYYNGGAYRRSKVEVVKSEVLYLVSLNNPEAASRIMFLLSQKFDKSDHARNNIMQDALLSAKAMGNQYVIDLITNMENEQNENNDNNDNNEQDEINAVKQK